MPNETLSSVEYKLRLLPAVDQPQRCNKMTSYRGPTIFPPLVKRRSSLCRPNKTNLIPCPVFFRNVPVGKISPLVVPQ